MILLSSGQEIMANVINENDESITIKDPFVLMVAGENRMGVVPWLPLAEKQDIVINKKDVILQYKPIKNLIDHYNQQTGNIVTAGPEVLNKLTRLSGFER